MGAARLAARAPAYSDQLRRPRDTAADIVQRCSPRATAAAYAFAVAQAAISPAIESAT
jgi:hypothetical protein